MKYYPPAPFAIIQDTREQTPLHFPASVPVIVRDLYPGDYSINGLTNQFAIERKSLEDLIGSLIGHKELQSGARRNNRDRLIEELSAMTPYKFKCVAVTSPRAKIEEHYYQSRIEPANVIGMIAAIEAFTGVQFKFFANPEECARWVAIEAFHFWRFANGLSQLRPKLQPERLTRKVAPMPKPPKKPKSTQKPIPPPAHAHARAHVTENHI